MKKKKNMVRISNFPKIPGKSSSWGSRSVCMTKLCGISIMVILPPKYWMQADKLENYC